MLEVEYGVVLALSQNVKSRQAIKAMTGDNHIVAAFLLPPFPSFHVLLLEPFWLFQSGACQSPAN